MTDQVTPSASPAPDPTAGEDRATEAVSQGGAQWQFISRAVTQASALGLFLVAVRVLSPADFGLFALMQAVSMMLFLIAAGGWREFIMSQSNARAAIDQAISIAIVAGLAMASVGAAAGALIAGPFGQETAGRLLMAFSVCVVASPLNNAYAGLLVRGGKLKALAIASIAAEGVGFLVGAGGLLAGWNVYALVWSKVAMLGVALAGSMVAARWAFRFRLRAGHGRELYLFSRQILGNRTVGALGNNAATFIIGAFLGVTSVGYYRAAERIISSVSELVYEPLRLVSWNRFRTAASGATGENLTTGATADTPQIRKALAADAATLFPLYLALAAPVFAGLAVVAGDAVELLLGPTWAPATPLVTILTLSSFMLVPSTTTEPLLSVTGQIKRILPYLVASTLLTIVILTVAASFGLLATAWGRVAATLVTISVIVWLQFDATGASWLAAGRRSLSIVAALSAMVAASYGCHVALSSMGAPLVLRLVAEIAAGAATYAGVLYALWPGILQLARRL